MKMQEWCPWMRIRLIFSTAMTLCLLERRGLPMMVSVHANRLQQQLHHSNNNNNNNNGAHSGLYGYLRKHEHKLPSTTTTTTTTSTNTTTNNDNINNNNNNIYNKIPTNATAIIPLMGISGSHHVHVYVGSPIPQKQTLIVDTGSRLMAFPCNPCRNCGKHSASSYYEPTLSTTNYIPTCSNDDDNNNNSCLLNGLSTCSKFSNHKLGKKCILQQQYTEGSSWTAYEIEDMVWVGSAFQEDRMEEWIQQLAVPYPFGCQTSESGLFRKQHADGILGLAIHPPSSLIDKMWKHGSIAANAFSLCLTKTNGVWNLGGTVPSYHTEEMKFTKQSRQHGWYAARVDKVMLNGICVACRRDDNKNDTNDDDTSSTSSLLLSAMEGGKGTIFDSGTTDTYLPKQLASRWERIWKDITGFPYAKRKRKYTYEEFQTLPILQIVFDGNVTLEVEPISYMEHATLTSTLWSGSSATTRELINRIYVDEPEGAVLGANAMFGYDIFFDNENNRIGLAKANCEDMGYHHTQTTTTSS